MWQLHAAVFPLDVYIMLLICSREVSHGVMDNTRYVDGRVSGSLCRYLRYSRYPTASILASWMFKSADKLKDYASDAASLDGRTYEKSSKLLRMRFVNSRQCKLTGPVAAADQDWKGCLLLSVYKSEDTFIRFLILILTCTDLILLAFRPAWGGQDW
ncbi:hypothetical protein MPTK2_2g12100 [Marchantia polymorpha subsp. ruderalis]